MELEYTYFEADEGGYIGYFNDFPQHVTEAETIEELEEMLLDMFQCLNLGKYRHDAQIPHPFGLVFGAAWFSSCNGKRLLMVFGKVKALKHV